MSDESDPPEDDDKPDSQSLRLLGLDFASFTGKFAEAVRYAAKPGRADKAGLHWVSMGPRNVVGRVRALAIDMHTPSTLYAGTAFGGVWKTTDEGDTWVALDTFRQPDLPSPVRQALPVGAIAVAPSRPDVVYVGTGEPIKDRFSGNGLFRSMDAGATFDQIAPAAANAGFFATRFERIAIDPWEPDRCWIACDTGLWRLEPGKGPIPDRTGDMTDVVIDFGDPRISRQRDVFTVYAAQRNQGIYRRDFDWKLSDYKKDSIWSLLPHGLPSVDFVRVKLALCWARPEFVYAIFELSGDRTSRVYVSDDRGDHWRATAPRGDEMTATQPFSHLVIEVHPDRPQVVFAGSVDLFRTLNGGESWEKVLDSKSFNEGDPSQHADQHAVAFDPIDPNRVWVANDGGVVMSRRLGGIVTPREKTSTAVSLPLPGGRWRRRGHGISASQFYDITVHPRHPFILGGGLQDNGTWVSFGGPTWFWMFGGDGGAMAFEPGDVKNFLATWQGPRDGKSLAGVQRLITQVAISPFGSFRTPLPDLPAPKAGAIATLRVGNQSLTTGFRDGHLAPFTGVLAHHPSTDNHALVGRQNAGYLTTDGRTFTKLNAGPFTATEFEVTALAYALTAPDRVWWLGTSKGEIFVTLNGNIKWDRRILPGGSGDIISSVAVHPNNPSIVAVAVTGAPGKVFLSGDDGVNWWDISGIDPKRPDEQLGPSPAACVVFDPLSDPDVGKDQVLYAGTPAGVSIIRNARAATAPTPPPGTPAPQWRTFNTELPLVLVTDLEPVVERDATSKITRTALRCATFGRGVFECDLMGAPAVRLYIRSTPVDDGRRYADPLTDDPRFPTPASSPTPLTPLQAFDLRVDASPFSFFGTRMDGVEFDEQLKPDSPVPGQNNIVYVQVHNGGWSPAANVEVRLFVAEALGTPPAIPDLPQDFWTTIAVSSPLVSVNSPGPWRPLGATTLASVAPGQPVVAAFDWTPLESAKGAVALLAFCTHAQDPLPFLGNSLPAPLPVATLVPDERRAVVRLVEIAPVAPDIFIRDGVDDDGSLGSVRWGGRSPDIIVVQAEILDPTAFRDLTNPRLGDRVRYGVDNHVYVRVSNRRSRAADAEIQLYRLSVQTPGQFSSWVLLKKVQVNSIPAKGWKLALKVTFNPGPAPSAPSPPETCLLLALALQPDDPAPGVTGLKTLDELWGILLSDPAANKAALRGLLIEP